MWTKAYVTGFTPKIWQYLPKQCREHSHTCSNLDLMEFIQFPIETNLVHQPNVGATWTRVLSLAAITVTIATHSSLLLWYFEITFGWCLWFLWNSSYLTKPFKINKGRLDLFLCHLSFSRKVVLPDLNLSDLKVNFVVIRFRRKSNTLNGPYLGSGNLENS